MPPYIVGLYRIAIDTDTACVIVCIAAQGHEDAIKRAHEYAARRLPRAAATEFKVTVVSVAPDGCLELDAFSKRNGAPE